MLTAPPLSADLLLSLASHDVSPPLLLSADLRGLLKSDDTCCSSSSSRVSMLLPPSSLSSASESDDSTLQTSASSSAAPAALRDEKAIASARRNFLRPEAASPDERRSWRAIAESDWRRIFQSVQEDGALEGDEDGSSATQRLQPARAPAIGSSIASGSTRTSSTVSTHSTHSTSTTVGAYRRLPSVESVAVLLRDCGSDAFASFTWETLLSPVLAHHALCHSPRTTPASPQSPQPESQMHLQPAPVDHGVQELLRLLVAQRCFRELTPKEFRAKVRARQFREHVGDSSFGARVELQLLALYHASRVRASQQTR